jgi:hypothetical protein
MAVGDRVQNPDYNGYSTHEVTDENIANGLKQAAQLVKIVSDSGASASPATEAKQDTGNTSLASIDTKFGQVQASPTANTLLARLKDLLTGIVLAPSTNNIGDVDVLTLKGAANLANGQVTAGTTSAEVVALRATRRSVLIRNTDPANSAYVGTGTVSAANGFLLKAGESITIETTAAVNSIRATSDVTLAYCEVYD